MSETKQIIRGRWVLLNAETVISDGAMVIAGGLIEEVGSWRPIQEKYPGLPVLGSDKHAIIPGLVNAHHHSNGITALQQGIPDQLLELWLLSLAKRRRIGPYLSTLLSAARLLRTGVTTVVDVHSGRGSPEEFESGIQEALRAYDEAGLRVAYAVGMTEQSFLAWGEDDAFLASLPDDVRRIAKQRLPDEETMTPDDYLAIVDDLWRQYQPHPRISIWFGPPGPQWVSDDFLIRIANQAEAYETGIQTHLLESVYEKHHGPRSYGQPTLLHLRDLGVLSSRFSFAHGVWLTEREIEVLAKSGAHVSHNPSSNLRLRAGIAPLNAMLAAGVNVGLGMDGTTLNDDEDMLAEMRLALNLHRTPHLEGPMPSVLDIWELATSGGAKLFQAETQLGRLAPSYAADIVLIRLGRITWPWVAPEADPRLLLLTRSKASDVDTVLVNGEVVLQDGKPTRFDLIAAGEALKEALEVSSVPEASIDMVERLSPYLEAHYNNWPFQTLDPYTEYNSRR
jgi:5-methylthioadenosine/S-adenosylhomocysteine deaminase